MKNKIKKTLALALCAAAVGAPVISGGIFAPECVEASTAGKTREQALAWARAQEGKGQDYDGFAGVQCTDLIQMYAAELGQKLPAVGAQKYISVDLPSGWKRYDNRTTPQAGDIFIYESNMYGAFSAGHVGIILDVDAEGYTCIDYNWSGRLYGSTRYVYGQKSFSYIIRPDFASSNISSAKQVSVEKGYYIINSATGNKFMDVSGKSSADRANIQLWSPGGHGGQAFYIDKNSSNNGYTLRNRTSGKYLHTETDTPGRHNVLQYKQNDSPGQSWIMQDAGNNYVFIRNFYNYYLDAENGRSDDGTNIGVHEYNGSAAQKWKLTRVSGIEKTKIAAGDYVIESKIGGKALDVAGGSKANGANIALWSPNNTTAQTFTIGWDNNLGCNYIYNKASGKYVDTKAPDGTDAANMTGDVKQSDKTLTKTQTWYFENAGDGYYYIRNLWGYYLDVTNAKNADGTNVTAWKFQGGDNQKWKLVKKDTRTGVYNVNGKWIYLNYGVQDKGFTAVTKSSSGNYVFIRNGEYDYSFTGVARSTSGSYVFVKNGRYNASYTGVARSTSGSDVFVKNGRYDPTFTGVARSTEGKYVYVKKGRFDNTATGVARAISGNYVYVNKGILDTSYTGLAKSLSSGALVYVSKGRYNPKFNGKAVYNGRTYTVKNGRV